MAPQALPTPRPRGPFPAEGSAERCGSWHAPSEVDVNPGRGRTGLSSAGAPHQTSPQLQAEPGPSRAGSTACRTAKTEGPWPAPSPGELQHQPSPTLLAYATSLRRAPTARAERRAMPWPQHTDLLQFLLKLFLTATAFLHSHPSRHTDIFLHILKLCHTPLSSFSHHQL